MAYQHAKKAIILARVSTEEQAQAGHFSIPAQLRILRDYVVDGGKFKAIKEIVGEYQFDESATRDTRKKFEEAIKIVETTEEPIAIIVERVDRFQRSFRESVRFDELRKEGKVELHFVSQGLFLYRNSPNSDLMTWDAFVMFAKSYTQQLSDNVKRSLREKLARGEYPGGDLPTGYTITSTVTEDGQIVKKKEIDKERADFVRRAFALFITDKYSTTMLAEKLAGEGFTCKARNGNPPKPVTFVDITNILNNPFYFGKFRYRNPDTGDQELWPKEGLATNYPIIMEKWETFEKAQAIMEKHNSRSNGFSRNSNFKFNGLLECGFCGYTLASEEMSRCYKDKNSEKAKGSVYYHCSNGHLQRDPDWYRKEFGLDHSGVYKARKGSKEEGQVKVKCPQKWWKESEIEEAIVKELELANYRENVYSWFRQALENNYKEDTMVLEDQIKSASKELAKNERIIKGLIHSMAVETDEGLKEAFKAEYAELKKKQAELKEEIANHEAAREANSDQLVDVLRYCSNLRDQYENLVDERKQDFLKIVFSKISLARGEYRIKLGKGQKWGRKLEENRIYFEWNEPFLTLHLGKIQELADEWHERVGKKMNAKLEEIVKGFGAEKDGLTKENSVEAFPKP